MELTPPIPVEVPLWLAAYLKKRDKCSIRTPEWLEPENLESTLEEERRQTSQLSALPFHYIEISKELLSIASDDLPDANRIRNLVADIEDIRRAKVQRGLQTLDETATNVAIPHISAMEINSIRRVTAGALDQMRMFGGGRDAAEQPTSGVETQSQSQHDGDEERNARLLRALQRRQRTG